MVTKVWKFEHPYEEADVALSKLQPGQIGIVCDCCEGLFVSVCFDQSLHPQHIDDYDVEEHIKVIREHAVPDCFHPSLRTFSETSASAQSELHYVSALALGKIRYTWELAKYVHGSQPVKRAIGELGGKGAVYVRMLLPKPMAEVGPVFRKLGLMCHAYMYKQVYMIIYVIYT